jgi:hypothetical protein
MKPTTEGSKVNFDIVCMSFGKEKEKDLKIIEGASKNSIFNEEMIINAENGELRSNNTLYSANGKAIKFEDNAFKTVKSNRKQKAEKGIVTNFENINKQNNKVEQEREA